MDPNHNSADQVSNSGVVIVSGASSGIGLAISKELLRAGYSVIGLGRDFSRADIEHEAFSSLQVDFSKPQQLAEQMLQMLEGIAGTVRALINNAGIGRMAYLEQLSFADLRETMDVNFLSHAVITKTLLPRLKQQDTQSDIIFMGSEAALKGAQQGSVYCASKFALRGFAQSLRQECARSAVNVSLINPGAVRTAFFDQLHFEPGVEAENAIEPRDVAAAVLLILQSRAGTVLDEINLSPKKHVWQRKPD